MNLRSIGLLLSLTGSLVVATPNEHHNHHHYAEFSKGELIEIVKEKDSAHYWHIIRARAEAGGLALAAGFIVGWIVGKMSNRN